MIASPNKSAVCGFRGTLCAVALLSALAHAAPLEAQAAGSSDLDVDLPEMLILHYFSTIEIQITHAQLSAILTGGEMVDEGTAAGSGWIVDLDIGPLADASLVADLARVTMLMQNAFAVRSIGDSTGRSQVRVRRIQRDGTHALGGLIRLGRTRIQVPFDGPANFVRFDSPGLTNPVVGDLVLEFNFNQVQYAGWYRGIQISLELTNL